MMTEPVWPVAPTIAIFILLGAIRPELQLRSEVVAARLYMPILNPLNMDNYKAIRNYLLGLDPVASVNFHIAALV